MYIVFLFILAMPIMVMEFAVGRASGQSVLWSFAVLRPEHKIWSLWGVISAGLVSLCEWENIELQWGISLKGATFEELYKLRVVRTGKVR